MNMMVRFPDTDKYARTIKASKAVHWDIETDVIRGRTFDQRGGIADGYYLSGPTAQVSLEKRFYLYKGLYASIEGKYTLSWARVPVSDGKADLWNSALHGLFGVGFEF